MYILTVQRYNYCQRCYINKENGASRGNTVILFYVRENWRMNVDETTTQLRDMFSRLE